MAVKLKAGDDTQEEMSEINVTPFIDVMLVLLIIFMVAAPLATVDVPVNLPSSSAEPQPKPNKPIYLTVQKDLTLSLGEDPVQDSDLRARLDTLTGGNLDERILLRGDAEVTYGDMMKVLNKLREAGYLKVALVGLETVR